MLVRMQQMIELCCESEGRCFGGCCEFGVVGVRWVMSRCVGRRLVCEVVLVCLCGVCGAVFDIVGISKFFVGWVL